jgi:hypothetical protein
LALFAALALVQIGLLSKDALAVVHAAREGAREAAVSTDEASVRQAALRSGTLVEARTTIAVERSGGLGDPVTVTIHYRSPIVVPFVDWLFSGDVTIRSGVTMRQEAE